MKILVVSNRKGGVGKTSVTSNLANEIRRQKLVTVIIDMDSQCDLTKVYLPNNHQHPTILDVLKGNTTIGNACHEVREDLYLIPGDKNLDTFNLKKSPMLLKRLLQQSLELKEGQVEVVIIDTPPGVNDSATMAYAAADHVLLVTNPETFGMENISLMIGELTNIKNTLNKKLNILGIAINKVDNRRKLAKYLQKELRKIFYGHVFNTYISNDTAIPTSQHRSKHVRELGWQSKVVGQFRNLTYEILLRMGIIDEKSVANQTAVRADQQSINGTPATGSSNQTLP